MGAALAGCGDNEDKPDAPVPDAEETNLVERGQYIMNTLGACTFCHTPLNPDGSRNMQRLFAGWSCNDTIPFLDADPTTAGVGCLNARNLTNHPTGLMNVTDEAIKNAIRNGVRTDGKSLVPVMPYWLFHNMSDEDLDAIVAYLRTVPGVDNTVPPNEPPWDDINNDNMAAPICTGATHVTGKCRSTPINPDDIPLPVGPNTTRAMRGRYLSSMAGLCIDCHTPDFPPPQGSQIPPFFPSMINMAKPFGGGRMFFREQLGLVDPSYPNMIFTRNLTPSATGLMGWTTEQISDAIARGKDRDGNAVCAATHGSMISPYAALDPTDLEDIAIYLSLLPPLDNDTGDNCAGPPVP
ncbi:MAG: cytochrome c [Kofleriaceae bacterium]|nr:cytochrome c [Kofleriaceae bacterium]